MPAKNDLSYLSEFVENWYVGSDKQKEFAKEVFENKLRVFVINLDSYLDHILKELFEKSFLQWDKDVKKLFDPKIGGPLASLTYKARLAYALGLINKAHLKDIERIHNVRNIFAHGINVDFTDTEICKEVRGMSIAKGHTITANKALKIICNFVENSKIELTNSEIDKLSKAAKKLSTGKGINLTLAKNMPFYYFLIVLKNIVYLSDILGKKFDAEVTMLQEMKNILDDELKKREKKNNIESQQSNP